MSGSEPKLVELTAAQTYPLRRSVLRAGTPTTEVRFVEDECADTTHLGLELDGEVVAVSTWVVRRYPDRPGDTGVQLRGMATATTHQGTGLGGRLLEAALERMAAKQVDLVWARARDAALEFYQRHGFTVVGRGYVDLATALDHHDVIRELG